MSHGRSSVRTGPAAGTNLLTCTFRSRTTASSEHETFRKRNHIQSNYSGPVFVTEEIYVPCTACLAPVNAVERVPVGASWYHPQCLHCQICKKGNRATAFYSVNGAPVCGTCHGAGGFAAKPDRRSFLQDHNVLTLSNGVRLDPRTTTVRQAILMERQAVCTTRDTNFTLALPPIRNGSASPHPPKRNSSLTPFNSIANGSSGDSTRRAIMNSSHSKQRHDEALAITENRNASAE